MRRLRAILTTAALWATVWVLGTLGFLAVAWVFIERVPLSGALFEFVLIASLLSAITGAISGSAFAIALMVAERRRTLDALSKARVALWGAVGGAALPAALLVLTRIWPEFGIAGVTFRLTGLTRTLVTLLASGAFGAGLAITHLVLARRLPAPRADHSLSTGAAT
jgi:hypothetical protein